MAGRQGGRRRAGVWLGGGEEEGGREDLGGAADVGTCQRRGFGILFGRREFTRAGQVQVRFHRRFGAGGFLGWY
jgi:hypothetical protein